MDLHCSPQNAQSSEQAETLNKSTESLDSTRSAGSTAANKSRRKRKPKKVSATDVPDNDLDLMNIDIESDLQTNIIRCVPKSALDARNPESDECETIAKIAQMVSTITSTTVFPPPAAAHQAPKTNDENLIENQLEQMFADSKDVKSPPEASVVNESTPNDSPKDIKKKKTLSKPRKKKGEAPAPGKKKKDLILAGKLKNGKPGKKGSKPADESKPEKKVKTKENGKSKVKPDVAPFVLIQKDGSFAIVNQTANGDDDTEKSVNKTKKSSGVDKNKTKAMRGLHVSTLSNKYDADKRDATWVCVFCKLGPHKHKLGDLFGPYIISTTSKDHENCLQDPATDIFRQSNKNKFTKIGSPPPSPEKPKKKRKLNDSSVKDVPASAPVGNDEIHNGMSRVDETNFEVWFHEDCIVWASGVYIIGTKIMGMESAIWSSTRYRCAYCNKNGAMVSCLERECRKPAHIGCSRTGWKLNDEFKTFCELHGSS